MLRKPQTSSVRVAITTLAVSAFGLAGIATDEAFRAQAYRDIGGIWTVGYGETQGVGPNTRTDPARALAQLVVRVEEHAQGVRKCVSAPLHQHEFDAYVSITYNIGVAGFCTSSIPKLLNAGDYTAACNKLVAFNKVRINGVLVESNGLTKRRLRERSTCLGEGYHV